MKFKGLALKNLLFEVEMATREIDYQKAMDKIGVIEPTVLELLKSRPVVRWSRAFFSSQG